MQSFKLTHLQELPRLLKDASTSLDNLLASNDVNTLRTWLTQRAVKLQSVKFGFSPGTGILSVNCIYEQKQSLSNFLEQSAEERLKLSNEGVIILGMLGLQADFDKGMFLRWQEEKVTQSRDTIFANLCLKEFMEKVGLGVVKVLKSPVRGKSNESRVRFWLASRKEIISKSTLTQLHQYSRTYFIEDKEELSQDMCSEFWKNMETQLYILDSSFVECLEIFLKPYFFSGVRRNTIFFSPAHNSFLKIYLEGTPGVGKSFFARCFRAAFEAVLSKNVDADIKVSLVKIPLNYLSPGHLKSILSVTGISDFSIERKIEQSLVKQNPVVLHLEENPKDKIQQEKMFSLVAKMVQKLCAKYPGSLERVIFLVTSNYPPEESVFSDFHKIKVRAPTQEKQNDWVKKQIIQTLVEQVRDICLKNSWKLYFDEFSFDLKVEKEVFPKLCTDLRPLSKLSRSLSFGCFELCKEHLETGKNSASNLQFKFSIAKGIGRGKSVLIKLSPVVNAFLSRRLHLQSSELAQKDQEEKYGSFVSLNSISTVSSDSISVSTQASTSVKLLSADGFFYCREKEILSVLNMTANGYLTPGVVLIKPTSSSTSLPNVSSAHEKLLNAIKLWGSKQNFHLFHKEVRLEIESDREKVSGAAKEVRGGLCKFIDDLNNLNSTSCTEVCLSCMDVSCSGNGSIDDRLIIVSCQVSCLGQFMLRDLLENSASTSSHRLKISKKKVLFILRPVVTAEENVFDEYSTQIMSRNSCIIHC
eukprot:snap_masked-scaffold_8-processed-gene-2.47-mRNA-1 protein AED:1.00 eAED:1.00 QI:0/-1/0/0/-1/1/1/0/754